VAEAARDSGVPGVGDELRWSVEVVAGAWSTGKHRGTEEWRKFWQKNPGEAELTMRRRWWLPNQRSGVVSGAQEGLVSLQREQGGWRCSSSGEGRGKEGNGAPAAS
jgi:hypothetical protein